MKLFDKIIFASFIVNLIFLISVLLLPVFALSFPEAFDQVFFSKDRSTFDLIVMPLNSVILFFWGYCIWFLFKYDRYSKSLLPLFFFNALYAPIYYYRVKIRKRPLRNKINKPGDRTVSENSIEESDFEKLTRDSIIGILELWSSKSEQIDFQKSQPGTNVTEELFETWNDLFVINSEAIRSVFSVSEFGLLTQFDQLIQDFDNQHNGMYSQLTDFMETEEWNELNSSAKEVLNELNKK